MALITRRWLLGAGVLVGVTGGAAYVGRRELDAWLVAPGPLAAETDLLLPRGTGMAGIAQAMETAGVVDHGWLLRLAARLSGRDRRLQAGEYRFAPGITPDAALAMLERGQRLLHRLTVPEGWTIQAAWRALEAEPTLDGPLPERPAEGGILPETYFFERDETRAVVAERMRAAMRRTLEELWAGRQAELPLASVEDAVTLASIVEKETSKPEEYPLVAGVYVNRLRRGMPLQADPTVIYALTRGESELGRDLLRKDLQKDDPYNTYRNAGLPPGPIALPGRGALAATLNPARTDALYFVADGTGGHAFARTLDEHNANVRRWRKLRDRAD